MSKRRLAISPPFRLPQNARGLTRMDELKKYDVRHPLKKATQERTVGMEKRMVCPTEIFAIMTRKDAWHKILKPCGNAVSSDDFAHIAYDKFLTPRYHVSRSVVHDGTLLFEYEAIFQSIIPLIDKTTFCLLDRPNLSGVKDIKYTIGDICVTTQYGVAFDNFSENYRVKNPDGVRSIASVPVVAEYII